MIAQPVAAEQSGFHPTIPYFRPKLVKQNEYKYSGYSVSP